MIASEHWDIHSLEMQTKKKANGRNASREHASPRVSRTVKKGSENVEVPKKKVTELITSSVRKQKSGILSSSSCIFVLCFWKVPVPVPAFNYLIFLNWKSAIYFFFKYETQKYIN